MVAQHDRHRCVSGRHLYRRHRLARPDRPLRDRPPDARRPAGDRVGLQRYAAIPLLTCDIVINLYLTTVFIYLLSPLVKDNTSSGNGVVNRVTLCISKALGRVQQKATMDLHRSNKALVKRVETLLQKTLIGCVLVILPTGGNLAAICILVGKELAFVSSDLDNPNEASRSNILFLDLSQSVHL